LRPCAGDSNEISKRISGPQLDRIDIHIEVPRVDYEQISNDRVGESSASIRQRFSKNGSLHIVYNADMRVGEISQYCKLPEEGQSLIRAAMSQLNLSARAHHLILKLARTITDLARCEKIQRPHLAEELHASQSPEINHELIWL
jgi:magnesium chelatase family protein